MFPFSSRTRGPHARRTTACYPTRRKMAVIRLDITHAGGAYPVLIGAGLTRNLGAIFAEQQLMTSTVVITCPPVWRLHGERVHEVLGGLTPLVMPDGEKAKHLATVARLYDGMV